MDARSKTDLLGQNHSRVNSLFRLSMTWTSKVRVLQLALGRLAHGSADQEWLDSLNADRKKEHLDKISYEAFEIVMDRLEKEWFDLVSDGFTSSRP